MQIMIVNPRFFRDKPEVIRGIICTNEKNKSKTVPQGKQRNPSLIVMLVQIIADVFLAMLSLDYHISRCVPLKCVICVNMCA